jgi:hypothetical protein
VSQLFLDAEEAKGTIFETVPVQAHVVLGDGYTRKEIDKGVYLTLNLRSDDGVDHQFDVFC